MRRLISFAYIDGRYYLIGSMWDCKEFDLNSPHSKYYFLEPSEYTDADRFIIGNSIEKKPRPQSISGNTPEEVLSKYFYAD